MATDIPRGVRGAVIERARGRCEYCHKPDDRMLNPYRHEVDHILAEKHGGDMTLDNLAYACFQCNRYKGTDLTSLDPHTNEVTRLFHPRTQPWDHHFSLTADGMITPRTPEGRATARLLRLNAPERVQTRADLIIAGLLTPTMQDTQ